MIKRLFLFLALIMVTAFAWGHDPQLSGIGVAVKGDTAMVAVQVHLAKLGAGDPASLISSRLALSINGVPFVAAHPSVQIDKDQGVAYWTAPFNGVVHTVKVDHRLFAEDAGARTIVSVTRDGDSLSETIVDAGHPSMSFGEGAKPLQKESAWSVIKQFLSLGVMHIFTGPDHILFIFGLILVGGSLKGLLKTVTAFTVAHSITLTVAATGLWVPASRFIEPLIALSIVVVALENLRPSKKAGQDWRPYIAFAFGLIHGFGFAGGLTEAGLPQGALGWALASFNIGVECAQAAIVLSVFPLLAMLAKRKPLINKRVILVGSLAISMAGMFWFIDRVRYPEITPTAPTAQVVQSAKRPA